jgi:hypothetical protein
MDEKDKTPAMTSDVLPGVKFQDPRPTDLQVFFSLLPTVLGGLASRADTRSTNPTAFLIIRECLGQCAMMGTLRATFMCNDGTPLALPAQNQVAMGVQAPVQHQPSNHGSMVQQYPNQPGQGQPSQGGMGGGGGMVQQYPNYAPPQQQGAPFGDGSKGVMVAMFPNNSQPPQSPPQL